MFLTELHKLLLRLKKTLYGILHKNKKKGEM